MTEGGIYNNITQYIKEVVLRQKGNLMIFLHPTYAKGGFPTFLGLFCCLIFTFTLIPLSMTD